MRETTGSMWIFQMMLIFILIFARFLCLVINYSKAYRVKNEVLSIIEEYEGVSEASQQIIDNYLMSQSYLTKGNCPEGWFGVDATTGTYEESTGRQAFSYCFIENEDENNYIYYDIMVFYQFNLPFLGDFMRFRVEGTTGTFIGNANRYQKG